MAKINLDALICREDFGVLGEQSQSNLFSNLPINQLISPVLYPFLRKPDFQRETNEWDEKKISGFIESFLNGELIPSIILWRNPTGYYFVIDGAHRLSALISWVYDDYGDGKYSREFYQNNISEEQLVNAEKARKYINRNIGSYVDVMNATQQESGSAKHLLEKAKSLGAYSIQVQWVDGDVSKAEKSFFKINQQASKIDKTELKLLKSRKKPNCIAARAIIRRGEGRHYWSDFSAENQNRIEDISKEISDLLFSPALKTPVKTLDLPLGGKQMTAASLPLILDFVNLANDVKSENEQELENDTTGDSTVHFLNRARKLIWRINSTHASSLGLHPAIYFYSREGKHKPASFTFTISFIKQLAKQNKLNGFTEKREKFEEFILNYDYLVQQLWRKYRQTSKAIPHVIDFYMFVLELLDQDEDVRFTLSKIKTNKKFDFLNINEEIENNIPQRSVFDTNQKSAVFIKDALGSSLKCKICNGYIHKNSITIDHIKRKEDGGLANINNGQIAHPYCNTTYKN
ncbi:MAG: GmrSD restriction endonuclease domain-containing protein [Alphaproteobacteria bacterium]